MPHGASPTLSIARRAILGALALLPLAAAARAQTGAQSPAQNLALTPDLAVGQEWSIKGEARAKAIIGWIEQGPDDQTTVLISLVDIPTPHGAAVIGFLPYEKAALAASLDQLVAAGVASPREFQPGYQDWQHGEGDPFTNPLANVIATFVAQLRATPGGR